MWVKLLCTFHRCSQCHNHPVCLILGVFIFTKSFLFFFCCLLSPKLCPSSLMYCIPTWSRCCPCISVQMGLDEVTPVTQLGTGYGPRATVGTFKMLTVDYFCWNSVFFPLELIHECHLVLSTLLLLILTIHFQTSCNEHLTMKLKIQLGNFHKFLMSGHCLKKLYVLPQSISPS